MFVETSGDVLVNFEGQVFYDVLYSFGCDGRFLGFGHRHVEEDEELLEGCLVHHVHHAHFYDQEIHDASSGERIVKREKCIVANTEIQITERFQGLGLPVCWLIGRVTMLSSLYCPSSGDSKKEVTPR